MCPCMCMGVWERRSWENSKEKREKKEKLNEEKDKRKQKLNHTDKSTDGQIDTNHSLIWDTILNNIVNRIQSNRIESNWIESIWNKVE